jgi:dihydroxyacetone kinase
MDDELKTLLDAKSDAPGFMVNGVSPVPTFLPALPDEKNRDVSYKVQTDSQCAFIRGEKLSFQNIIYLVDKMSEIIIENEIPFCELDSRAGDGDFGMSIAKGFRSLKIDWEEITARSKTIGEFLDACSVVILEYCGGASGPIWGFAFKYAAKAAAGKTELDIDAFAGILQAAVQGVQETGRRAFGRGAVVGDKTLIDALVPCADSWSASAKKGTAFLEGFKRAAEAAVAGAAKTRDIVARMGRAENAGKRSLGYPDAGAHALGVIFTELAESLR